MRLPPQSMPVNRGRRQGKCSTNEVEAAQFEDLDDDDDLGAEDVLDDVDV